MLTLTVVERDGCTTTVAHQVLLTISRFIPMISRILLAASFALAWLNNSLFTLKLMKWTSRITWYDVQDALTPQIPFALRVRWRLFIIILDSLWWGVTSWQTA